MKINLFGVGRSGTKALQLFLGFFLARRYGSVWLNYEPYYWKNRFLSELNYRGIYHHIDASLIMEKDELSLSHKNFLVELQKNKEAVITKFIRGCGRIDSINGVMKPDYSFVVIRDLYSILNSIAAYDWDLLGVNLIHKNDWTKLIEEVSSKNKLGISYDPNKFTDKLEKNAFYWYVMNKIALKNQDAIFLDFHNMNQIFSFAEKIGLKPDEDIYDKKFNGHLLHQDKTLITLNEKAKIKKNNLFYQFMMRDIHLFSKLPFACQMFPFQEIGESSVAVQECMDYELAKPYSKTRLQVKEKVIFNRLNEEIKEEMTQKIKQQS